MQRSKISNKWFYAPILILGIYFLIRLIDQSQIIWNFPIDQYANDWSSHITKLFFLAKYGFQHVVPNWYNGNYILLKYYSPGWYLFALPLFYLFRDAQLATYVSVIFVYILSFVCICLLGKSQGISPIKRIAFFLFFFANPLSIGYLLRLGRLPEFFAWMWFILFFMITVLYKDRKLNKDFIWFIPVFVMLFYVHLLTAIVSSIMILCLFFIKDNKERLYIILSCFFILLLTSPFWINLFSLQDRAITTIPLQRLIISGWISDKIAAFVIPLLFLGVFYFYWVGEKKSKKELTFYSPLLIFSILLLTRIAIFIPFINRATSDSYSLLLIFVSIFLFLKTKFPNKKFKLFFCYSLTLISVLCVIISILFTPFFVPHNENIQNLFSLFEKVDGNLLLVNIPGEIHHGAAYSYGSLNYNICTPAGWDITNLPEEYYTDLRKIYGYTEIGDCIGIKFIAQEYKLKNIISYNGGCNNLKNCGLKEKSEKGGFCLMKI